MNDAPERIWADAQIEHVGNRNNYHNGWGDAPRELFHEEWDTEPTEYIRADLHEVAALVEAGERLADGAEGMVRLLDVMMRQPGRDLSGSESDTVDAISIAIGAFRAALRAKAKGPQP